MKLESTLNDKPGLLHISPVLDVVLLLLIFFLLGSAFMVRPGITVDLPQSTSTLKGFSEARVLTISAGAQPRIMLDGSLIDLSKLGQELGSMQASETLVIRADELATHGLVVEVANIAMAAGYRIAIATAPPATE